MKGSVDRNRKCSAGVFGVVLAICGCASVASTGLDRTKLRVGAYCVHSVMMTERHVKDVKACGVDYLVCTSMDKVTPGNREFLDWCAKHGVGVYISNGVLNGRPGWWDSSRHGGTPTDIGQLNRVKELVGEFRKNLDHPAVEMIDLYDEPSALTFPYYGELVGIVNGLSPDKPGFVNLFPVYAFAAGNSTALEKSQLGAKTYRDYIAEYCRNFPSDYICYDHYQYLSDDPAVVRQFCARCYDNMIAVADACRATGRSFWYVPQVNSYEKSTRALSANQLRFQAFSALAFGAEAITWACYSKGWWKNNVIDDRGEKTVQYEKLKTVNAELHRLGPSYMRFRNTATHFIGFKDHAEEIPARTARSLDKLDNGFFMDVKASDGSQLVIGEMTARNPEDRAKALFVFAAGDVNDERRAEHVVEFRVRGFGRVSALGPDGRIDLARGEDGRCSFRIKDNSCAIIGIK